MASEGTTVVLGIPIPSTNPIFLAIIGVHVLFGLAAVITGGAAMLSKKGRGRHSNFGTIYFWCLFVVFVYERSVRHALGRELSLVRSRATFVRGCAFWAHCCAATLPPMAQAPSHWHGRVVYFYAYCVLRGQRQEPATLWRELPQIAFWFLPSAIGLPLILYALR